ncbi:MAG: hypothetical protein AAB404_01890 [Patescibacteria group bacterium]
MKKGFAQWLLNLVMVVVIAALWILATPYIIEVSPKKLQPTSTSTERPLKQLAVDQNGHSSYFFLGYSEITENEREYCFYYKTSEDSKFILTRAPFGKTNIVEDGQNKVIFFTKFSLLSSDAIENKIDSGDLGIVEKFEFHIPPNSILKKCNPGLCREEFVS